MASVHKGKEAEREIVRLLQPKVESAYEQVRKHLPTAVTPRLQRNTLACDGGGYDVVGLSWLALEIKNHKAPAVNDWWAQCLRQARPGQEPVLVYKKTGGPWRVRLWVTRDMRNGYCWRVAGDVSMKDFLDYFEQRTFIEAFGGKENT